MLLGILAGFVPAGALFRPPRLGARVYTDKFIKDVIHECWEASLRFPHKVFFGKLKKIKPGVCTKVFQ